MIIRTIPSGKTPLQLLFEEKRVQIWIKRLDLAQPTGSAKDYLAESMAQSLLDRLSPGERVVFGGSGNTAAALASILIPQGFGLTVIVPQTQNPGDIANIQRLGARVVFEGSQEANQALETGFLFDQSEDEAGLEAAELIGREIGISFSNQPLTLVGGFGSGATLLGTAKSLRQNVPGSKIIATQPWGYNLDLWLAYLKAKANGLNFKGQLQTIQVILDRYRQMGFYVELETYPDRNPDQWFVIWIDVDGPSIMDGIGVADGGPSILAREYIPLLDEVITIKAVDAFAAARELCANGITVGESTGANWVAAQQIAKQMIDQGQTGAIVFLAHAVLRDQTRIDPPTGKHMASCAKLDLWQVQSQEELLGHTQVRGLLDLYVDVFAKSAWRIALSPSATEDLLLTIQGLDHSLILVGTDARGLTRTILAAYPLVEDREFSQIVQAHGNNPPVCFYLDTVLTATEWHGQGVASELMRLMESWAREQGFTKIILRTTEELPQLEAFYERRGYRKFPETRHPVEVTRTNGTTETDHRHLFVKEL